MPTERGGGGGGVGVWSLEVKLMPSVRKYGHALVPSLPTSL